MTEEVSRQTLDFTVAEGGPEFTVALTNADGSPIKIPPGNYKIALIGVAQPAPNPDPGHVDPPPDPKPDPDQPPAPPAPPEPPAIDFGQAKATVTIARSMLKVGQPIGKFTGCDKAGATWKVVLDRGEGDVDNSFVTVSGGRTPTLGKSVPADKKALSVRFELQDGQRALPDHSNRWDLPCVINIA